MNQETTTFARIYGSPVNPSTPGKMRAEVSLHPLHFPDQESRTEDAAIHLRVATDAEPSTGRSIMLNKDEAEALIQALVWYRSRIKKP